eukprot:6877744-Prymnesium_polylepis.2
MACHVREGACHIRESKAEGRGKVGGASGGAAASGGVAGWCRSSWPESRSVVGRGGCTAPLHGVCAGERELVGEV